MTAAIARWLWGVARRLIFLVLIFPAIVLQFVLWLLFGSAAPEPADALEDWAK